MDLKDLIRNRRIELGLTMKELAELVGVSEGTISRWESGEISNMKRDKIYLLATALGISPSVIMGWSASDADTDIPDWYSNPAVAAIAQQIYEDKDRMFLFELLPDLTPEQIRLLYSMAKSWQSKDDE